MYVIKSFAFTLFMRLTPLLVIMLTGINYYIDLAHVYIMAHDISLETFDFIVVGAGSGGSVVAHRLSKHSKVLLLEAGGDPIAVQSIPGLAFGLLNQPEIDWSYSTEPQTHAAFGFKKNSILISRGRTLGGTGSLNFGFYLRGHPLDYDNWATLTGNPDWSYENVLPYFKKSIRNYKGKYSANEKHWGSNVYGFLEIEDINYSPLATEFLQGGQELGFEIVDVNGPQKSGFGTIQLTQKDGQRYSTYYSLLRNPKYSNNLKILRYSQVHKILLDKSNRAVGVRFNQHGRLNEVVATKEIIVSAGSIDSPKLLMLSGIGPKTHLKSIGIKPIVDLPVGKNLQDHLYSAVGPFSISKPISMVPARDLTLNALWDYIWKGKGPLSGVVSFGQAFISSSKKKSKGVDWPDLQLYLQGNPPFAQTQYLLEKSQGFRPEFVNEIFGNFSGLDGFFLHVALARPKSRGEITLKDKNPNSLPIINPRYLSNREDVLTMIEGIKVIMNLTENTAAFKEINTTFSKKPIPGCEDHVFRSDNYFECFIRFMATTIWHPVGTCAMGMDSSSAVVDSQLRVFHTKGLRVIDASIMPVIVNANTNAPTYLIAEKGADFIRSYWSQQFLVTYYFDYVLRRNENKCYYSKMM